jgi:hypothetical protein
MQWAPPHHQYSTSYHSLFSPQTHASNSQGQTPAYYQSYHYATTNHPQPSPVTQITYPSPVLQITYPMPNSTNQQTKPETNTPPPPLLQICEPPQQNDNFPTNETNLTITRGSNTAFDNKRQLRDYYRQVNHVVVEDPITKTKWSHIPITFSAQDIKLASFPQTDAMVITIHIDI